MRIDKFSPFEIEIAFSKRNLQALLEKLEWNSARTIVKQEGPLKLTVRIEPDDVHYVSPEGPPGIMLNGKGDLY